MARSFDGSTNRIDYSAPVDFAAASQAQTHAFWFNRDASSSSSKYFFAFNSSVPTHRVILWSSGGGTYDLGLEFLINRSTTAMARPAVDASYSAGAWTHCCVTHDGSDTATNAHIYINGSEVSYDTGANGSGTTDTAVTLSLGGRVADDLRNFNGDMAEWGSWNRILAAGEIAALANAFSPLFFPRGLVHYVPLIRETQDLVNGAATTVDGTTVADHPRIIYPG